MVLNRLWSIGGKNGWYYANWLWGIRGFIDKLSGGVGLRRGRKNRTKYHPAIRSTSGVCSMQTGTAKRLCYMRR